MSKRSSGDSEPYTDSEEGQIEAALDRAELGYVGAAPTRMTVCAQIEWAGTFSGRDGYRRTTLDGLDLSPVQGALAAVRAARQRAERAGSSLTATGWLSQFRYLASTPAGYRALTDAGLSASIRTQTAWLTGDHAASKANRSRIAEAYSTQREAIRDRAADVAQKATHAVAEALTAALRERYGSEIRFRDITELEFRA